MSNEVIYRELLMTQELIKPQFDFKIVEKDTSIYDYKYALIDIDNDFKITIQTRYYQEENTEVYILNARHDKSYVERWVSLDSSNYIKEIINFFEEYKEKKSKEYLSEKANGYDQFRLF